MLLQSKRLGVWPSRTFRHYMLSNHYHNCQLHACMHVFASQLSPEVVQSVKIFKYSNIFENIPYDDTHIHICSEIFFRNIIHICICSRQGLWIIFVFVFVQEKNICCTPNSPIIVKIQRKNEYFFQSFFFFKEYGKFLISYP